MSLLKLCSVVVLTRGMVLGGACGHFKVFGLPRAIPTSKQYLYSGTLIIWTLLATALMLAYQISETVRIAEVLTFLADLWCK